MLNRNGLPENRMTTSTADTFLDNLLLYLLARATSQASAPMHERVRKHGLSIPEWRTVMTIADTPRTIGDLAGLLRMKQPTLTRLLDRMEQAGLIQRKSDPKDGRRVLAALTARGETLARDLIPMALAYDADLLKQYSPEEAETLKGALRVLIDRTATD